MTQYQGDDLDITGEARDVNGDAVSLSGATIYCTLKSGSTSRACDSFAVLTDNTYRVRFRSASTAAMATGQWSGDVRAKLATGEVVTIGTVPVFNLATAKTPTP